MLCLRRIAALLAHLILVGAVLIGCGVEPPVGVDDRTTDTDHFEAKPMLPAHALPGERNGAGKGDQFDDLRNANPLIYGITAAPKTPLRAVAQFDDHQAMLLTWTGNFPETYAGVVDGAKSVVDIYVLHEGNAAKQDFNNNMAQQGTSTAGLHYINMQNDSIWIRDYGPLSVRSPDGEVAFVDPRYYHERPYDDAIPTQVASLWGMHSYRQPLKWEGGTYMADGHGNCYYSQGVYWYGGTAQSKIHTYQRDYLGCETNIVLKPLVGEGTTHSDMFAKLTSKNHMILGQYASWQDPTNKATLDQNENIIEAASLNDGTSVQVTRIPMPSNSAGTVWRTYANSLFVNGVNLVPVYTDDTSFQADALAVWQSVMPDWNHVPVDSTGLIQWSGAVRYRAVPLPRQELLLQ